MGFMYLFLLVIQAASTINGASTGRNRRSLGELKDLIRCVTDRNPSDYINYGCWCGVGGSEDPVDQVDQCCQDHDRCYDTLLDSKKCKGLDVYATTYALPYSQENGCPATMDKSNCVVGNRCGRGLCGCDVQLARCLKRAPFHPQYYKYSRYIGCSFRTFLHSMGNIF